MFMQPVVGLFSISIIQWQFVEINHAVVFDQWVYKWLGFNHDSYIMFKLLIVLLLNQSRYNT